MWRNRRATVPAFCLRPRDIAAVVDLIALRAIGLLGLGVG